MLNFTLAVTGRGEATFAGTPSPPASHLTSRDTVTVTVATAPAILTGLTAAPGDGRATLGWTAPEAGGSPITGYRYRVSADAGVTWNPDWTDVPDGDDADADAANETTYTVTGLTNGTEYTFQVQAVNEMGAGGEGAATATPRAAPKLSIANAEGPETAGVTFTVTLSLSILDPASATWTVSIGDDDTAVTDDLGDVRTGIVTIPAGETSTTFTVATNDDEDAESNETFTVTLSEPSGADLDADAATAVGTITDGVCDRTEKIRQALQRGVSGGCAAVTATRLASIRNLQLANVRPPFVGNRFVENRGFRRSDRAENPQPVPLNSDQRASEPAYSTNWRSWKR